MERKAEIHVKIYSSEKKGKVILTVRSGAENKGKNGYLSLHDFVEERRWILVAH